MSGAEMNMLYSTERYELPHCVIFKYTNKKSKLVLIKIAFMCNWYFPD